jgi:hypothetical protein
MPPPGIAGATAGVLGTSATMASVVMSRPAYCALRAPPWLGRCLAPTLKRNDIVVVDNPRAHKVVGVREAIEAATATLLYLP